MDSTREKGIEKGKRRKSDGEKVVKTLKLREKEEQKRLNIVISGIPLE